MSENRDKAQGTWEELKGSVKRNVGDALDDERMESEGTAQELGGRGQVEGAKARGRAAGTVDEGIGKLKKNVGDLLDDERTEAEGTAEELKGRARRESNR